VKLGKRCPEVLVDSLAILLEGARRPYLIARVPNRAALEAFAVRSGSGGPAHELEERTFASARPVDSRRVARGPTGGRFALRAEWNGYFRSP